MAAAGNDNMTRAEAERLLYRTASSKGNFYARASKQLRGELAHAIPKEILRRLHHRTAWKHFLIVGLMLAAMVASGWALWNPVAWWIVPPLIVVIGFGAFNFTVLLHEVVHDAVFDGRRSKATHLLGKLYAMPCGISASQFTRWHLDHHAELGNSEDDPKRHHLSPKINARWLKLLYFTPGLFFIYFRAARRETSLYPESIRRMISRERLAAIALHLMVASSLWWIGGAGVALRLHILPIVIVFPIAFALNRLGQHYDIDPENIAAWSTLVKPSWFWDRAFLFSNYHLEHHYFPRVPFYNLPELHRRLKPFYEKHGVHARSYSELLWNYIVLNRKPHTRWHSETHS